MTEPHKRNRHPNYKTAYRVNNWRKYEQWHCQLVGADLVTGQQTTYSGLDTHRRSP